MSRRRGLLSSAVVAAIIFGASAALAGAPQPHAASGYDNFHRFKSPQIGIFLVTSATNPDKLNGGPAIYHSGPEGSSGTIVCPTVALKPGFTAAVAEFGFPGTTLKLSRGKYTFYLKWTSPKTTVAGGVKSPVKLHLALTGTVVSASTIRGRLIVNGGGCATSKPIPYTAALDRKFPLPPGS